MFLELTPKCNERLYIATTSNDLDDNVEARDRMIGVGRCRIFIVWRRFFIVLRYRNECS
jgi:hypothetical protein